MRHGGKQRFALRQRMAHKGKLEKLQIAQSAVKQLGRGRGCGPAQIAHLGQTDRQAPPRRIARDAAAVDAAADDEKIVLRGHRESSANENG